MNFIADTGVNGNCKKGQDCHLVAIKLYNNGISLSLPKTKPHEVYMKKEHKTFMKKYQ